MKRQTLFTFYFLLFTYIIKAQFLFYQDTYKGGVTSDGRSYYGFDYLQADSFALYTHIPSGASIRKAYLISIRIKRGATPLSEVPLQLKLNNYSFTLDSSDIVTNNFSCYLAITNTTCMVAKDVTSFVNSSGNILVVACQGCISNPIVYGGYLLVVMYEMPSYPTVNTTIFLDAQTYSSNMAYNLYGLNPINNVNDVGLSVFMCDPNDTAKINLSSSSSNTYLGFIGAMNYISPNDTNYHYASGSFYYENSTLFGLRDDNPNNGFDTSDALVNIKNYIPNNCQTFTLNVKNGGNGCGETIDASILAYTTPCPTRNNTNNIITYPPICSNGNMQLHGASVGNYTWSASNNSLNNYNIPNPTASPTITTNYIALVDSAGCKHTEQHRVDVYTVPKTDSVKTTIGICGSTPGTATIIASAGSPASYTVNSMVQSSPNYTNLAAGTYTFALSNAFGCTYTSPKAFIIKDTNLARSRFYVSPDSGCGPLTVNCTNYSNYDGNNIYSPTTNAYTWYTNGDSAHAANFTYTFADTGKYSVTLLAYETQRKCSATSTQTVLVKYCPPDSIKITVPNVFSPNGDNINETWQPIVHNYNYTINNYECTIYDRWGIKVFSTTNINTAWDGKTTSGLTCNAGTYYYVIKYSASNTIGTNKQEDFKGYLELVK